MFGEWSPVIIAAGGLWIVGAALVSTWRQVMVRTGRWVPATATIVGDRGRRRSGRLRLVVEVPVDGDTRRAPLNASRFTVGEAYRAAHPSDEPPPTGPTPTRLPALEDQLVGFEVPVAVSPRRNPLGRHHVQHVDRQGVTASTIGTALALALGVAILVWQGPDALDVLAG